MNVREIALQALVSALVVSAIGFAYHRYVVAPALRFGVVDIADVYRLKERQMVDIISKAGVTQAEKTHAMEIAVEFTKRLPMALDQLPQECGCIVLVRTAIATDMPGMADLTPLLKSKVGL